VPRNYCSKQRRALFAAAAKAITTTATMQPSMQAPLKETEIKT